MSNTGSPWASAKLQSIHQLIESLSYFRPESRCWTPIKLSSDFVIANRARVSQRRCRWRKCRLQHNSYSLLLHDYILRVGLLLACREASTVARVAVCLRVDTVPARTEDECRWCALSEPGEMRER